jgi:hypothetical protein
MNIQKTIVLLLHAFVGWALCAATMGIGMALTSLETTLIVHAIGAPIFFFIVSLVYYKKFSYTTPMQTAVIFTTFVILVDFFLVAMVINRSFEMFSSLLGTWIPFGLIYASTWLAGTFYNNQTQQKNFRQISTE